jgi:hypothetical protein
VLLLPILPGVNILFDLLSAKPEMERELLTAVVRAVLQLRKLSHG